MHWVISPDINTTTNHHTKSVVLQTCMYNIGYHNFQDYAKKKTASLFALVGQLTVITLAQLQLKAQFYFNFKSLSHASVIAIVCKQITNIGC